MTSDCGRDDFSAVTRLLTYVTQPIRKMNEIRHMYPDTRLGYYP